MSAAPSANDLLTGSAPPPNADRRPPATSRSDVALMRIMWERMGWPPPIETITDVERNPGGRTEEQRRRPHVVPPGRNDAVFYYSPTNTAKLPDDQYLLHKWDERQVLVGTALDEGIQELAVAHQDDKDYLNDLVWRAKRRAKADTNADRGTARHKIAEKLDFGVDPGPLNPTLRADIDSYRAATRGLEMVLGEMFVVHDEQRMGGTFDRVVYYQGRYYIADLKPPDSGFGQGAHAIQFAIYSRSLLYNWNLAQHLLATNPKALATTQLRTEFPQPLDQDRAIVIYVPRGGIGRASVAWVNIAEGWQGFEHAQWMRRWRQRSFQEDLVTPFTPTPPPTVIDTAVTGVAGLPGWKGRPDRAAESVQRVAALAGNTSSAGRATAPAVSTLPGRKITEVHLPGEAAADEAANTAAVARAGGITEPEDPADPLSEIALTDPVIAELRTATDLEGLKAIYQKARQAGKWYQRHTEEYGRLRPKITGEPNPERSTA